MAAKICSADDLKAQMAASASCLFALHFNASFADECKQVDALFTALAADEEYSNIEAEEVAEVSLRYKIEAVPTVVLVANGESVDRVEGADTASITKAIREQIERRGLVSGAAKQKLTARLKELVSKEKIMLFMKGSPDVPRCGFSRTIVGMLREEDVDFGFFDILSDPAVRQGLKEYSEWPTYPQLYVNGELLGGLDVIRDMKDSGDLHEALTSS